MSHKNNFDVSVIKASWVWDLWVLLSLVYGVCLGLDLLIFSAFLWLLLLLYLFRYSEMTTELITSII